MLGYRRGQFMIIMPFFTYPFFYLFHAFSFLGYGYDYFFCFVLCTVRVFFFFFWVTLFFFCFFFSDTPQYTVLYGPLFVSCISTGHGASLRWEGGEGGDLLKGNVHYNFYLCERIGSEREIWGFLGGLKVLGMVRLRVGHEIVENCPGIRWFLRVGHWNVGMLCGWDLGWWLGRYIVV